MGSKVQSVLSYAGVLWLLASFLGKDQRGDDSRYHLKQGLGLLVLAISFSAVVSVIGAMVPIAAKVFGIGGFLFVMLMVFGIIHTVNDIKSHCLLHANGLRIALHLLTGNKSSHAGRF